MKRFALLFLTIALFTIACKKSKNTPVNSFTGKWKLAATKISPGVPVNWTPVTNNDKYVQFNSSGTFESNTDYFKKYSKYTVKDSTTITLSKNDTIQNYLYQFIKQDTLIIRMFCIEECAVKFVKQN
jgi:hypothetical protein